MPDWADGTVWWHVYPLGFVGAPRAAWSGMEVTHRLPRLIRWLDYAVEMGANGLALGPIFQSTSHGYDTLDFHRIDPRLGDEADFDALVRAVRDRGMRLMLDGVFNHVGQEHPLFRKALADGPESEAASWFRLTWPPDRRPGEAPYFSTFEGHRQLPALNHDNPKVADFVVEVMNRRLDRGVDAWRLDAAHAVPAPFWREVFARVRAVHPDVFFQAEVLFGDFVHVVEAGGFDSLTQYELWHGLTSALNDKAMFKLGWAFDRHNAYLDRFAPSTFLGNHDVTRIASLLNDERHLPHALAVLLFSGGIPSIYYGDEQAFRGEKERRQGGDDSLRPAFPDKPEDLWPYGWPHYRLHQRLIALRREHPWIARAETRPIQIADDYFVYELRAGAEALFVALNVGDRSENLRVPGARTVLAGEARVTAPGTDSATVHLADHGWAVVDPR